MDDLRSQLDEAHSDISQLEAHVSQLEEQLDEARLEIRNHKNQGIYVSHLIQYPCNIKNNKNSNNCF